MIRLGRHRHDLTRVGVIRGDDGQRVHARRAHTLVTCNCAALPTALLESELFGHERGSFTGAADSRIGRFELANHGTIFLDEIGETPLEVQPKLLRVLQEQEFERVGSSHTLRTDVRVIAATKANLPQMVAAKRFRADLYYRLNVFPIQVPPCASDRRTFRCSCGISRARQHGA